MDYYNEIDPYCAQWLSNLMDAGVINRGVVDTRSVEDVTPNDLRGFNQCHFFAGIGVWAYALRNAGLGDQRGLWTGSCPCQPFSAAGKAGGFADERHLWPAFHHLISVCRPSIVLGEQVASKDGLTWLDLVSSDLQGSGYAFGAQDLCGAGFGAPHIRQRLWFVGLDHRVGKGLEGYAWDGDYSTRWPDAPRPTSTAGGDGGVANSDHKQSGKRRNANMQRRRPNHTEQDGVGSEFGRVADPYGRNAGTEGLQRSGQHRQQQEDGGAVVGMADDTFVGRREGREDRSGGGRGDEAQGRAAGRLCGSTVERMADTESPRSTDGSQDARSGGSVSGEGQPLFGVGHNGAPSEWTGPTNGFWRDADWLFCRDGKWRPVEPGTFPLAHGASGRVGRLRAYGNAIIAPVAEEFCRSVREYVETVESGV